MYLAADGLSALAACTAYSRYILDVGQSEDWFALQVALTPCVIGYGAAARALHQEHATTRDDAHPYWKWVENYTNDAYAAVAKRTVGTYRTCPTRNSSK